MIAVDHEMIASISALRVLATSDLLERDRLGLFYEQARRALRAHNGWSTIAVCDSTGQQVVNLFLPMGSPLPFSGNIPVIRTVLDTRRPAISDLHTGPVSGGPIVGVGVPVMRGDQLEYALLAGLDVRMLTRLLSETKLPRGWIATIIDRNGVIIARTQNIDTLLGTPATPTFVQRSRAAEEGSFKDVTRDGVAVYAAFSRSQLSGWTIGLGLPAVDVEGPGRKALAGIVGGGLLFLAVAGGLALVSGRQIVDAIAALSTAARSVAHGEAPEWTDTTGIREIDHAGREMAAAARGRRLAQIEHRRVEAALEESEERLQLLVARALDAVVTIDAEGRVASWNPQAVQLFGWSQEEILGRRLSETIVPEALRESHERGLARFRATGQGTVLDQRLEMTALHRDGREFPVEISIAAIRMGGAVSFGAFIRDISDRRRQEAERLRQSEEPFRMLVDGVRDYAITLLDADGRVASWNTGAEQINGYRAEEMSAGPPPCSTRRTPTARSSSPTSSRRRGRSVASSPRAGGSGRTARATSPTW